MSEPSEFDIGAALGKFWADYVDEDEAEFYTTEEVAEHLGIDWPGEEGKP